MSTSGMYLDVVQGGSITLTASFTTYVGSGQPLAVGGVTITIALVGGSPIVGPTSTGVTGQGWTWQYTWAPSTTIPPGDYTATFTPSSPSGTPPLVQTVTVVALPSATPSPGVYASVGDYETWSGDTITPSARVQIFLQRATEIIDVALVGAVYATDANGMPVDAALIDCLRRATCAQVQYMLANNDIANVKDQFVSSNVGGVTLTRAAAATARALPPLAPQAAAILRVAGVLPAAPLINW